MLGGYDDYKTNPDYFDNFASAIYDLDTVRVTFADGSVLEIPTSQVNDNLSAQGSARHSVATIDVFARQRLGEGKSKIIPNRFTLQTAPKFSRWFLEEQRKTAETAQLLGEAGRLSLTANQPPPELWWLALARPTARLGFRGYGAYRAYSAPRLEEPKYAR